tara:strand:- start:270 stop:458 length:189 start_codon:yes stop_codon:yes gene_type:complete
MSCPNCISGSLNDGKYICREDGYKVEDLSENVIFVVMEDDVEGEEVDTFDNIKYCICGYWGE